MQIPAHSLAPSHFHHLFIRNTNRHRSLLPECVCVCVSEIAFVLVAYQITYNRFSLSSTFDCTTIIIATLNVLFPLRVCVCVCIIYIIVAVIRK
jgi:hypothetical protein